MHEVIQRRILQHLFCNPLVKLRCLRAFSEHIETVRQPQLKAHVLGLHFCGALQNDLRAGVRVCPLRRNLRAQVKVKLGEADQEFSIRTLHFCRVIKQRQNFRCLFVLQELQEKALVTRERTRIRLNGHPPGLNSLIGFAQLGINKTKLREKAAGHDCVVGRAR